MKKPLTSLLFTLLFFQNCAHRQGVQRDHIVQGSCEKVFQEADLSPGQSIWENVSEAGGTGASYLVTGLGYSTDFVVTFTSGLVGSIILCSPSIVGALASTNTGGARHHLVCMDGSSMKGIIENLNPQLGPKADISTQKWRCPNLEPVALGLERVAQCYRKTGNNESAKEQLRRIDSSVIFNRCLSRQTKDRISTQLTEISKN